MVDSEILIEMLENTDEIRRLIKSQKFNIGDAMKLSDRYFNIYRKMEQLIISRDKWKAKYEKLKAKTKYEKLKAS